MYNPPHFREDRIDVLHDLIRRHSLATLVVLGPGGLEANHIPMLIDADPQPLGRLRGHVSRANTMWRTFSRDFPALAIFSGPESYVTPSWYETKQVSGKVVPTWNYVAVHAYGRIETFDDPGRLLAVVTDLTNTQEAGFEPPWQVSDAPQDFIQSQLKAIVGIEIAIERLEGKWKVSQNRPAPDRAGVAAGLEELAALAKQRGS